MEFENEFDVKAPLDEVWQAMLDVERVAPCVPGAEVLERTGDDAYKVGIKVKVGPVSMQYRGQVEIVEKDPESRSAVMSARARESRGQGTATAHVRMHLDGDNGATHGRMITEVALSGRAAAMGQGVIQDVSARIVEQFAANLAAMLGGAAGAEAPSAEAPSAEAPSADAQAEAPTQVRPQPDIEPAPTTESPAAASVAPPAAEQQQAAAPPPPPPSSQTKDESLDIVPIISGVVGKRLRDPRVLAGLAILVLLLLRRRR